VKVGLGQIALRMGDKAGNLAVLTATIADAAAAGCDVVVLPECPMGGWCRLGVPRLQPWRHDRSPLEGLG
jgi:predicted amidohydrolase